jgi:hypothetical protein
MGKHIQLTIADPCHEDWDKMTKSEKGKFCGSCQKQVIDFTGMTDTQLATFFKKKATETVCGRFYNDQLDRGLPVPRKRIPWVKYFFQITLPLFLASGKLKAQGMVKVKTTEKQSCSSNQILGGISRQVTWDEDLMVDQGALIRGIIINQEGKPVPYATIDRGIRGIAADSTGAFSLIVASNPKGIKLKVSSVGYESREVVLTNKEINSSEPVKITLTPNNLMGEVVITGYQNLQRVPMMGGLSIVSYKVESELEVLTPPEPGAGFKIYANPAKANSNVFINAGDTETGLYAVQLRNLSGQLIKQEQTRIEKGMGAISFSIPVIPSGTYLVSLVNKKTGKKSSEKLIVQ